MDIKKRRVWIPYILLLIGMLVLFLITAWPKDAQPKPADMSGYTKLQEKHKFLSSDMKQVLDMFHKQETAIVYIGFIECAWCQDAVPVLNQAAQELNTNVYYVEARKDDQVLITEEQRLEFYKLAEEHLDKDENGQPALFTPYVFKIKNGKITASHISTIEGHKAKERALSEEEASELLKIYKDVLSS